MTKSEFLAQLKSALQENLNSSTVQENMDYYNRYIIEETAKGKSEEEVVNMLGDPWILAKTITDASDGTDWETVYEARRGSTGSSSSYQDREYRQDNRDSQGLGGRAWARIILLILFVVMIFMLIFSIISGLVSFFAPVLVPILIVMFVVRLFGGRRS